MVVGVGGPLSLPGTSADTTRTGMAEGLISGLRNGDNG